MMPERAKPKIPVLEAALKLLDRRACSERELAARLRRAGYPPAECSHAVSECRRMGFVNDELLAADCTGMMMSRGSGSRMIQWKLRQRGLPPEAVSSALREHAADEPEAARSALEMKWRLLARESDPRRKREKALRFLLGRGFPPDLVRRVWEEFRSAAHDAADDDGTDW